MPLGFGQLLLAEDQVDLAARIDAVAPGRQLALQGAHARRLAERGLEPAGGLLGPPAMSGVPS